MKAIDSPQSLVQEYTAKFPKSAELWARATKVMPAGINHDVRRVVPFPLYMDRAHGCRKWDVDGNEFVDLATGHGSLILGHGHPAIVKALQDQIAAVTHPGAPSPQEIEWAERVIRLAPCAELVRFVLTGTEATMLAMRVARACTDRPVIVKIQGHFHGWHDYGMVGLGPPFSLPSSNGVPNALQATIRVVPLNDLGAIEEALLPHDVAAVILEPDGPGAGAVPVAPGYLAALRELTLTHGSLLIFDEVITGFRLAPGGAQQYFGVTPDLATYAKAIAGGVPGGAVAGRAEVMSFLGFSDDPDWNRRQKVSHMGTFSGYPVAAAAGVVALDLLADGSVQKHVGTMATRLKNGINGALREARVAGCAYGGSTVRVTLGDDLPPAHDPAEFLAVVPPMRLLEGTRPALAREMQRAQLLEGLDLLSGTHGWTSIAMAEADIDEAVRRFARALQRVLDVGSVNRYSPTHP